MITGTSKIPSIRPSWRALSHIKIPTDSTSSRPQSRVIPSNQSISNIKTSIISRSPPILFLKSPRNHNPPASISQNHPPFSKHPQAAQKRHRATLECANHAASHSGDHCSRPAARIGSWAAAGRCRATDRDRPNLHMQAGVHADACILRKPASQPATVAAVYRKPGLP